MSDILQQVRHKFGIELERHAMNWNFELVDVPCSAVEKVLPLAFFCGSFVLIQENELTDIVQLVGKDSLSEVSGGRLAVSLDRKS